MWTSRFEAYRSSHKFNPSKKNTSLKYIVIKLSKIKNRDKTLKAAREKNYLIKKNLINVPVDFSRETLQPGREWDDIFNALKLKKKKKENKNKNCQPRIFYLANLSFRNERENKAFPVKQKLR